jgi:hypothetical protein
MLWIAGRGALASVESRGGDVQAEAEVAEAAEVEVEVVGFAADDGDVG